MLRAIVDFFAASVQSYMCASFVCKAFPVKEPKNKSLLLVFLKNMTSYVVVNYVFSATRLQKIIAGDIIFILFGYFVYEGTRITKVLKSVFEHFFFIAMDTILEILLMPFFMSVLLELPFLQRQLLGRNIATCAIFILYALYEIFSQRKEKRHVKGVAESAVCLGMIQLISMDLLSKSNPKALVEGRLMVTMLFSLTMIGGYLIVDELFKQMLKQRNKQTELEQMALEKEYQYDYYKKAVVQGERLRDLRHDMRNQLQTVEYLIQSEEEEDRKRAEEMVKVILDEFSRLESVVKE